MARRAQAKRYAQAVFEIALAKNQLDEWQSDLRKIAGLIEEAVVVLLENPKLRFSDKARLLAERLGDVNPLAQNLAYVLVARRRLSMIGEVADEFERLVDSHRGIERAEIITATPLDDEERVKLEQRLGAIVGKKVVVKPEVDTGLLGGLVARVAGKLLDGSTRSRLEALKRELGGSVR